MFYKTRNFKPQEVKEEVKNTISNEYADRAIHKDFPGIADDDSEHRYTLTADELREIYFKGWDAYEKAAAKIERETTRAKLAALDFWSEHKNWIPTDYDELMQLCLEYYSRAEH